MTLLRSHLLVLSALAAWLAPSVCTTAAPPASSAPATIEKPAEEPLGQPDATAISHHVIRLNGRDLAYRATAGFLAIRNEAGKEQASLFHVAYVLDKQDPAKRPITFVFNGGPGAASLWLHMGALGPKRVELADDGTALPKTIKLVENESCWLDFTDLVFIDPVGSGYSTAAAGVDPKEFFGLDGDVRSVGEFIRAYVSGAGRWASPKFLAGESYGTTRAAGLATYLADHAGMNVNGLILLSSALNFATFSFHPGNDLACQLYVPSYTAVAWYHHRLGAELQKDLPTALAQSEKWAIDEYGPALAKGSDLPAAQRAKVIDRLKYFTGLPDDYIDHSDLRIASRRFAAELLRSQKKVIGFLDGRVAGPAEDPAASSLGEDPAFFLVAGPFTAAMQDYLRRELLFRSERRYVYLSEAANGSWNWGSARGGYVDVSGDLKSAMTANRNLKVLAAAGYFDLTCGYFAQRYTFNHLGLPEEIRKNLTQKYYPSGHQVYNHLPSLAAFTADAAELVKSATGE